MTRPNWIFLAWAPYGRRSESLARELGAEMHFVHYLRFRIPLIAPFKYFLQALRTSWILLARRPKVVIVQSPPIFCALIVYLHSIIFSTRFVLDHHTDSFSSRWAFVRPLQRFLARRAVTNLVSSEHWATLVEAWGAAARILEDAVPEFPDFPLYKVGGGFNIVMINTFADDEPLSEVLAAARYLPDVKFYITGDLAKQPSKRLVDLHENIIFTGFLPEQEYIGLLRAADAIMALTTRDHTLQGGGFEAIAVGKPLITSDWPVLRHLFARGAIYTKNSVNGIRRAIEEMKDLSEVLSRDMLVYREEKRAAWRESMVRFVEMVSARPYRQRASSKDETGGVPNETRTD